MLAGLGEDSRMMPITFNGYWIKMPPSQPFLLCKILSILFAAVSPFESLINACTLPKLFYKFLPGAPHSDLGCGLGCWCRLSIVEAELKIRTNLLKYLKLQSGLCSGCGLYIVMNYALYTDTVCVWISSCLPGRFLARQYYSP